MVREAADEDLRVRRVFLLQCRGHRADGRRRTGVGLIGVVMSSVPRLEAGDDGSGRVLDVGVDGDACRNFPEDKVCMKLTVTLPEF